MLHELVKIWFGWVENWGYWGVFLLMALESSIVPVPSEVVIPPAAFWAAQGRMTLAGVVLAGTIGSWFGSTISYFLGKALGPPFLKRFGKFILLPEQKLELAEKWVLRYGLPGIFFARLLPVVRHLISYPAGMFRMRFVSFSLVTAAGAAIWCTVLAWFGKEAIGNSPELLQSPEAMIAVIKARLHWFALGVLVFGALYGVVIWIKNRGSARELNTAARL